MQHAAIQLHTLTYNWTRVMQLANTPPLQSTTPSLHPVSIHQTSPPVRGSKHPITAYYSIYRPRKYDGLSWPSWLTCIERFTHMVTHRLQVERGTGKVRRPKTDVLPLCHANCGWFTVFGCDDYYSIPQLHFDVNWHRTAEFWQLCTAHASLTHFLTVGQVASVDFYPK